MQKTVSDYIIKHSEWQNELILLKDLVLSQPLEETIKWGAPVYTFKGKNIVGLGAFKSYVGLWFFQGALLKDKEQKLVNAQEGKTQAMRQWRFNSLSEIEANSSLITDYVKEAVANQKAGKEIKPKAGKPLEIPLELQEVLHKDTELKEAFEALNLTRKRDFAEYITLAKRAETKQSRLEKIIPMIRQGIGLNDKYK
ncbi:YdeI/OmpD-associated family protein [Roseivirga thermotolerans]|nr:YdeI/OmpD-associated family protein [Roseivirga thermotolerans]